MVLLVKIRFALDFILGRKIKFLISSLLLGVCFVMVGFTCLIYIAGMYSRVSAEQALSCGVSHTGIFMVDNNYEVYMEREDSDGVGKQFQQELCGTDQIEGIGSFVVCAAADTAAFQELYDIQKGHGLNTTSGIEELEFRMIDTNEESFSMVNLEFEEGGIRTSEEENFYYICLGYAYRDIPIGTQFVYESDDLTMTYEVSGILKRNSLLPTDEMVSDVFDFTTMDNQMNLDYEAICVYSGSISSFPCLFAVNKAYSYEEGIAVIDEIAKKYGLEYSAESLEDKFDKANKYVAVIQDSLLETLLLLVVVTVIIIICLHIVWMDQSGNTFGIMYAIGFSGREIQAMLFVYNIIHMICSVCVGMAGLYVIGQYCYAYNEALRETFQQILFGYALPVDFVVIALIILLISAIQTWIFRCKQPMQLLREE